VADAYENWHDLEENEAAKGLFEAQSELSGTAAE
jgi:hypothetical protein